MSYKHLDTPEKCAFWCFTGLMITIFCFAGLGVLAAGLEVYKNYAEYFGKG